MFFQAVFDQSLQSLYETVGHDHAGAHALHGIDHALLRGVFRWLLTFRASDQGV